MNDFSGNAVARLYDVGVAGIHRLFHRRDRLDSGRVLIVGANAATSRINHL